MLLLLLLQWQCENAEGEKHPEDDLGVVSARVFFCMFFFLIFGSNTPSRGC